jgi:hypothetical protein
MALRFLHSSICFHLPVSRTVATFFIHPLLSPRSFLLALPVIAHPSNPREMPRDPREMEKMEGEQKNSSSTVASPDSVGLTGVLLHRTVSVRLSLYTVLPQLSKLGLKTSNFTPSIVFEVFFCSNL